ncbi:DUF6879 family protein [Streptomyces caatingaensis]|uniref:DUF6879 domain-containing protein n=1 Tax=Streptomyces caatingaensis TaxID=1678637 RepID=A0A0K9XFH1_9ACTN|nr:DUF6879 family protein [Streptomyces caatingaensis]KNB51988.1 hypothetical protein AC230_14925 [Streptomyces caatingaensis]
MSQRKQPPSFEELLESAQVSAVHLEMRDAYGIGPEADDFERWKRTGQRDIDAGSDYWAPWVELIARTVARGVVVRRARIVSEPVTEYIRYEHAGTQVNIGAGEQVRWLPRRRASDIALPGNDFWLFDERLVMFNHFTGDGASAGPSVSEDPDVAKLCASAFEAVWERGIPHEEYQV